MSGLNELSYKLKYARNPNGNYTLLISHPNGTANKRYDNQYRERQLQNRARTREFVKWFRRTFKHIQTEFRGLSSNHWYDSKRHFVAYEVPPKDFMFLKLAKETEMSELAIGYKSNGQLGQDYIYENHTRPSEELLARLGKNSATIPCRAF